MMKESEGTPQMIKIAAAVRKGAMSYLKQQYKIVGWVFLGLVIGSLVKGKRRYGVLFAAATLAQALGTVLYLALTMLISGTGATFLQQFAGGREEEMLSAADEMDLFNAMATSGLSAASRSRPRRARWYS